MLERLNRTALAMLLGFLAVAVSLTYWGVFASDDILARPDNVRRLEAERAIRRGTIYDRAGDVLAESVEVGRSPSGMPVMRREYPWLEAVSVVGYYNPIQGTGGAEAAYDLELRGAARADAGTTLIDALIHRPIVGSDLRLTIDRDVQIDMARAFERRSGAAVVIEASSGAIWGLLSAPGFDPAAPNLDWDALRADPESPLLNRVTHGIYQPGGALQTVILAAMITHLPALPDLAEDASAPVLVNGLTLTCARDPDAPVATIQQAYALGCPAPFVEAALGQPGPERVQALIEAFGLTQTPPLARFETAVGRPAPALAAIAPPGRQRAAAAGQGALTVTPLQMALVASAIANDGTAVAPYLADAIRAPDASEWAALPSFGEPMAALTREAAESLREAMREAVLEGAALPAASAEVPPGALLHGHASIAYTGQTANAWFIGFITLPDGRAFAAAVVVEGTSDAGAAASVGGEILASAAWQALERESVP